MNKRKIWSTMLSLVVTIAILTIFGGVAVSADATVIDSGSCGDNITYTLYSDGLMEITGTGAMTDYFYGSEAPWYDYSADITSVTISSGITHIGKNSFSYNYTNLETVSIPDSVTSIGAYAFNYCSGLTTAALPTNSTSSGDHAFEGCQTLETINVPSDVQTIGEYAFSGCGLIPSFNFSDTLTSIGKYAFDGCGSLTSIGEHALDNCSIINEKTFSYCCSLL